MTLRKESTTLNFIAREILTVRFFARYNSNDRRIIKKYLTEQFRYMRLLSELHENKNYHLFGKTIVRHTLHYVSIMYLHHSSHQISHLLTEI